MKPPHPVARAPGVVRRHNRFEQRAPIHGAVVIVGIDLGQVTVPARLLHPQLQWGLVGMQPDSGSSVRAANAALAHLQPLIVGQTLGLDQLQGWTKLAL